MQAKKKEHSAFFELGCADLKLVEKNLGDKDIREQLLLFHLQQAAEKLLKSLLSLKQIKFPRVHDIGELIELSKEGGIELPGYTEEFINLNPYAVEFRYGLIIEEILDIQHYYQIVSEFKKFVEKMQEKCTPK